jgi:hypothetical protein
VPSTSNNTPDYQALPSTGDRISNQAAEQIVVVQIIVKSRPNLNDKTETPNRAFGESRSWTRFFVVVWR